MSKMYRTLPIVMLGLFVFSGCQKEIDFDTPVAGGSNSGSSTGIFKAKIDGVQYTSVVAAGSMLRGVMAISAYNKDKKYFVISIADTVTGTYVMNQNSSNALAFVDSTDANTNSFTTNQGTDSIQAGGVVTITSIDKVKKTISGTFSCRIFREQDSKQKVIMEGSFTVPYTSGMAPAKATDTFRVKIDGADWTAKSITAVATGGLLVVNGSEINLSKVLGFQLPQAITTGTYDLDLTGSYVGLYLPDGTTPYIADTGKLTILERNISTRRIRANFNFIATALVSTNSHQMTEGYFSVTY